MDFIKYLEEELIPRVINAKLSKSVKLLLIKTIKHIILKYEEMHIHRNKLIDEYKKLRKELESLKND